MLNEDNKYQLEKIYSLIVEILKIKKEEIKEITSIKRGMTNRTFFIQCRSGKYMLRIPGEGTEYLIHRSQEADVYQAIAGRGICEDNLYLDVENGIKLTRYIEHAHTCDPFCKTEVKKCMEKLRKFHELKLMVKHDFNIFEQIDFYESLWNERRTKYKDYLKTKENIFSLRHLMSQLGSPKVLCHIDAVPDNFLFAPDEKGREMLHLVDWEYAGMHDPHIDIAMFGIYSMYDVPQMEELMEMYFDGECTERNRIKIYCYIAACGLLWSNWCEYKRMLGIKFGEYAARQYDYAKEYFAIASDAVKRWEIE